MRATFCCFLLTWPLRRSARQALGVFGNWGAFRAKAAALRSPSPSRARRAEGWQPFASVGYWPGRRSARQVHFRLSRAKRPGSAVLLRIDGRTFQLIGGGRDAWAPDGRADADIVAAMRTGVDLVVETRSTRGRQVRDHLPAARRRHRDRRRRLACARRPMTGRFFIARHGETVFNAAARMQGETPHTPLTRAGFAQADEMGALSPRPAGAEAGARRSGPRRPGARCRRWR